MKIVAMNKLKYVILISGGVYVDGYDTKTLSPMWLRGQMGLVNQVMEICAAYLSY